MAKKHKHQEQHKKSSEKVRDFIIGMSDGLTVPFALAAGLSGVNLSANLIVTAGFAEIAAGSIAMALGGYLATRTERDHYFAEYEREVYEVEEFPLIEEREVVEILKEFGVPEEKLKTVVKSIISDKKRWVEFMMRFELGLEEPNSDRLYLSPLIIGSAYIFGGLIPLFPYMISDNVSHALIASCVTTGVALAIFGFLKGVMTGMNKLKSALQTTMIGGCAATAAYFIASLF